ncbi:MAG TPA: DUF6786 family protein [Polyangiaceae bacterium]|jgi:hypothetical protein|nr:DUF6786 family protein [Polyangiaceae bacterium]
MRRIVIGALACAACSGQGQRQPESAAVETKAAGSAVPGAVAKPAAEQAPEPEPAAEPPKDEPRVPPGDGSFGDDVAFLREHTEVVVLGDAANGAAVAITPEYQGRVMTSAARGAHGTSFGFINREVVAARRKQPHITVFGGEDRFWLGPEGGQFGLYFPPGSPYDFEHWQVPAAIDWGSWAITTQSATEVRFIKDIAVTNHLGTELTLRVERHVRLLSEAEIGAHLGSAVAPGASAVGYQSENSITNTGTAPWSKKTGLPSIWILGMYRPSPTTTVVIPFRPGPEKTLGKVVNDAYFGKISGSRLRTEKSVLLFSGDGKERGKIGVPAPRARPVAGSYDAANGVLTLVEYTLPERGAYVNSMWEEQAEPYSGDVVNSYNDGPPGPGQKPLGPFYELETSSPGAELAPGKTLTHVHRTLHLQGSVESIDPVARRKLGVGIEEITGRVVSK